MTQAILEITKEEVKPQTQKEIERQRLLEMADLAEKQLKAKCIEMFGIGGL